MINSALRFLAAGWRRMQTPAAPPAHANPRKSDTPIDFILLSFPRSGNHWLRYIIEWFSGRPTLGAGEGEHENDFVNPVDAPIGARVSIPHMALDASPIAKKRHQLTPWDNRDAGLLLILRNYKESVVRQLQLTPGWSGSLDVREKPVADLLRHYWELVQTFDQWHGNRHLVHYEDLVQSPRGSIEALLAFMRIAASDAQLESFFGGYSRHKENSLAALTDPSATRGESVASHARRLSGEQRRAWDGFMRQMDRALFERYLKRYEEDAEQNT